MVAFGVLWAFGLCRVGLSEDVASPASVNAAFSPTLLLNQTGSAFGPPHQWDMFGNHGGFAIRNAPGTMAQTQPFNIVAGAPNNSIRVDGTGQLGLGTATPLASIHVLAPIDPRLRLEQDGSVMGAPLQVWDLSGNASGFSLVDVTADGTFPFRVSPGLPTNALIVTKDNRGDANLGIGGIATNQRHLHIRSGSSVATIRMEATLANFERTWEIAAGSGGFFLSDLSAGSPLSIFAGAPNQTLVLGGTGNVGIAPTTFANTFTPQRTLHLRDIEDVPTLRFEDANARLTTEHIWDIEADQFGFDLVNDPDTPNETRPFTVLPDAPTASLFVATNGSIGLGTNLPQMIGNTVATGRLINVRSDTSNSRFVMQGQTGGLMELVDLSAAADRKIFRIFSRSGFTRFQVVKDDLSAFTVNNVLAFDMSNGNVGLRVASPLHPLHLASGAHCTAGGVFTNASSREFKQDIQPLTSEQAHDTVRALQPVRFRYQTEPNEQYIGFIAEDVPALVATNDRKSLAPMDVVAVLTRVVQDQDRQLDEQRRVNAQQQELLAALTKRLTDLEQRLGHNGPSTP